MKGKTRSLRSACSLLLCTLVLLAAAPGSAPAADTFAGPPPDLPPAWAPFCDAGLLNGSAGPQAVAVCVPAMPMGILIYAHGYVAPLPPPGPGDNPWDRINPVEIDAVAGLLPVVLDAGFIVAATTYSKEGYAVEAADGDLTILIDAIRAQAGGLPLPVVIVGASEGGLITAMMVEKYPGAIAGGLAMCGPVAGMAHQLKYLGDFRAVFDYFFDWRGGRRDVFPFGVVDVPADAYLQWPAYAAGVDAVIRRNLLRAAGLFRVTGAALSYNPFTRIDSAVETSLSVLRYSIFGTGDLIATAGGGFPTGNVTTWYSGTFWDWHLNRKVERFAANADAALYVDEWYTPHGNLAVPLVTLHTTRDPSVPFEHEIIYRARANDNLTSLAVWRYGHCDFTELEILFALQLTLRKILMQQGGAVRLPDLSGLDLYGAGMTVAPMP